VSANTAVSRRPHVGAPDHDAAPRYQAASSFAVTAATLAFAALLAARAPMPFEAEIDVALAKTAAIYPVPKALVVAVISVESGFRPRAISRAGAKGLMQLMPYTARRVGIAERDLFDPAKNVLGGVRLLAVLLRHYDGDVISALVAYNDRPRRLFAPIPRNGETPTYVWNVLAALRRQTLPRNKTVLDLPGRGRVTSIDTTRILGERGRPVPARSPLLSRPRATPDTRGPGPITYRPDLFFVASTSLYVEPGVVVGGSVSPFATVTSCPLPPRGPICWYCPDFGASCPGFRPPALLFDIIHLGASARVEELLDVASNAPRKTQTPAAAWDHPRTVAVLARPAEPSSVEPSSSGATLPDESDAVACQAVSTSGLDRDIASRHNATAVLHHCAAEEVGWRSSPETRSANS
jgi:hypothetical protein